MAHADNVRRYFPAIRQATFLNTGTFGLLPEVAVQTMQSALADQLTRGRGTRYYGDLASVKDKIREQLANLLDAPSECFALTDSTTDAMNIVTNGLHWQPGDEVIVTDAEYPGAMVSLFALCERRDVTLRVVDGALPEEEFMRQLERVLSPRTRLCVVSHVSFQTGQRMPVENIARMAHRYGAHLLVDGAQGAGADAISLRNSEVDFYALPGQKWLCGPDGTGALYVRADLFSVLRPVSQSYTSVKAVDAYNWTGSYLSWADARRFEHTTIGLERLMGWYESLQLMRVTIGWDFVFSRIHGMSGYLMDRLLDFDFVRVLTPRDSRAGLIVFQLQNQTAETFVKQARERDIVVRSISERRAVRVSTGCYNSEEDLDRVVQLVAEIGRQANAVGKSAL